LPRRLSFSRPRRLQMGPRTARGFVPKFFVSTQRKALTAGPALAGTQVGRVRRRFPVAVREGSFLRGFARKPQRFLEAVGHRAAPAAPPAPAQGASRPPPARA